MPKSLIKQTRVLLSLRATLTLSPLGPAGPVIPLSPGMPCRPGGPGSPTIPAGPSLPCTDINVYQDYHDVVVDKTTIKCFYHGKSFQLMYSFYVVQLCKWCYSVIF